MRRYEGLLRPLARPAPWPARWCVVDTAGAAIPVTDRVGIRRTGLESWHLLVLTMRGSEVLCQEESFGNTPEALWTALGALSGRAGLTWTISPRALYSWTLLGFWERLLLGQLTLWQDRPIRQRGKPDRGLGRPPGLLMAADPPSAAGIQLASVKERLTWVCAGNFGWKGQFLDVAGLSSCRQLAAAVSTSSALLAEHKLGGWGITLGSMAMRAWRSQHMKECLYVSQNERARRLGTEAIAGGYLYHSATTPGARQGYWLDGKGLYAYLASASDLPTGLRHTSMYRGCTAEPDGSEQYRTIQRVRLLSRDGRFPVRYEGQTCWPRGVCETVLSGPELEIAHKQGLIREYGEYATFNLSKPLERFCGACLALRAAAESRACVCAGLLAKGLAVALVGKLHAYDEEWEECRPDYNDPICGSWQGPDGRGGLTEWTALAGQVSRRVRRGLSWHAVPEIPLWIWSLGRVWLWERIDCAGLSEVMYADTDGLAVTQRGYDRLCDRGYIRVNEWGQLRLVQGPVDIEVVGPKQVRIGSEIIQAGAPRNQRGDDFAAEGYWFRRPLNGAGEGWQDGYFEEEWRARQPVHQAASL